jgi:hypothetical protein
LLGGRAAARRERRGIAARLARAAWRERAVASRLSGAFEAAAAADAADVARHLAILDEAVANLAEQAGDPAGLAGELDALGRAVLEKLAETARALERAAAGAGLDDAADPAT